MGETVRERERVTYSVEQAAALLGIGKNHAYDLIGEGKIPGVIRLGRRIVVSKAKLDSFLKDPDKLSKERNADYVSSSSKVRFVDISEPES